MGNIYLKNISMRAVILILALSALVMTTEVQKMTLMPQHFQTMTHYENPWSSGSSTPKCRSDELPGQIQGANGVGCFPKSTNNTCPTDVPSGTTATAFPLVQDSEGNTYCALVCKGYATGTCASGAQCVSPSGKQTFGMQLQAMVAICLSPQPTLSTIDN